MLDHFEDLIAGLSKIINIPLHVDQNNSCLLEFNEKTKVQIQPSKSRRHLILGSIIAELPPGKSRELIFREVFC